MQINKAVKIPNRILKLWSFWAEVSDSFYSTGKSEKLHSLQIRFFFFLMKYVFWIRIWHSANCHKRQLLSSGKVSWRTPPLLYHLFQVMRAQERTRVVMDCVSVLEVFGGKQPSLISRYVWKERRKTKVKTKFLHTTKTNHSYVANRSCC